MPTHARTAATYIDRHRHNDRPRDECSATKSHGKNKYICISYDRLQVGPRIGTRSEKHSTRKRLERTSPPSNSQAIKCRLIIIACGTRNKTTSAIAIILNG